MCLFCGVLPEIENIPRLYSGVTVSSWYGKTKLFDDNNEIYEESVNDPLEFYGGTLQTGINLLFSTSENSYLSVNSNLHRSEHWFSKKFIASLFAAI